MHEKINGEMYEVNLESGSAYAVVCDGCKFQSGVTDCPPCRGVNRDDGLDVYFTEIVSMRECMTDVKLSGPGTRIRGLVAEAHATLGAPDEYHKDGVSEAYEAAKSDVDPDGLDAHAPGAKLDAGKVQAGVLLDFSHALMAIAEVGTFGAERYSRGGWQSVRNGVQRYTDAQGRHQLKRGIEGEIDSDSGLMHRAHECWNALASLELYIREKEERDA